MIPECFASAKQGRRDALVKRYRLDLRPCGLLVKMSVFRVRTRAKVYELLYNISFGDNADISLI